jgi:hypothetical protein
LWAQRKLPAKNQLSEADARQVEEAFASKLAVIQAQNANSDEVVPEQSLVEQTSAATQINKSVLGFPEPRRIRDRDHIRHVIEQACLVCGRRPSDPHHLRFAQSRALGRKVSDEFTVPLCRAHHREIHRCGNEGSWWRNTGIDPLAAARAGLKHIRCREREPPSRITGKLATGDTADLSSSIIHRSLARRIFLPALSVKIVTRVRIPAQFSAASPFGATSLQERLL